MAEAAVKKAGRQAHRFDEMATMVNDRSENPEEAGVDRYVGLEHLDPESLKIRRWGSPSEVTATKLRFRKGDIIFGRRRAYQRKLAVADFDGICSAHAMVLRAKPDVVLPDFLPFFMRSDLFMERAKEISVGSLSPTINWKTLAKQEFALPPLGEQRQLGETMRAATAVRESTIELAIAARMALVAASYQEFDKVIQATGHMTRLSKLCSRGPQNGIYKSEEFRKRGTPMIGMTELFAGDVIDDAHSSQRVELTSEEHERFMLSSNDLLFGRRSVVLEGAGKCVRVGPGAQRAVFESSVLRVKIDDTLADPRYVFEWFQSPSGHQQVRRIVTFTTVSGVAGSDVARLPVPVPSLDVQRDIADRLSTIRQQLRGLETRTRKSSELTRSVLATILEPAP